MHTREAAEELADEIMRLYPHVTINITETNYTDRSNYFILGVYGPGYSLPCFTLSFKHEWEEIQQAIAVLIPERAGQRTAPAFEQAMLGSDQEPDKTVAFEVTTTVGDTHEVRTYTLATLPDGLKPLAYLLRESEFVNLEFTMRLAHFRIAPESKPA